MAHALLGNVKEPTYATENPGNCQDDIKTLYAGTAGVITAARREGC